MKIIIHLRRAEAFKACALILFPKREKGRKIMRIEKVGYGEYDFFLTLGNEEIRIASLRGQLVGLDKMFLYMHFPTKECSRIVLDLKYHAYEEVFEKSKRIIQKKLYKYSQDILTSIAEVNKDQSSKSFGIG